MTAMRHFVPRSLAFLAVAAMMLGEGSAAAKSKLTKVAPSRLSDEITIVDGTVMVPVDDLVATVGCTLKAEAKSRFYEAWPCKAEGAFQVDVGALAGYAKSTKPSKGETQGFNPQPDPPRELHFGEHVVSRKVVLHDGRAYLDLGEVAKLMGGTVKGKGKKARIMIGDGSVRVITLFDRPSSAPQALQ